MKKKYIFLLLMFLFRGGINAQELYGFSGNVFGSVNLSDNSIDTLFVFSGFPWINLGFRSAIDRYNGRYFFGGSIPGYDGEFHIIDLVDLSIESYPVFPDEIEYDFIKNRLIYGKQAAFYALDLNTFEENRIGNTVIGNHYYGKTRTFEPHSNQYFFSKSSHLGPQLMSVDATTGSITCQVGIEETNGKYCVPHGVVTNNLTGEIMCNSNEMFGIVDPCNGTFIKLVEIPDYSAHLGNQMAVYNHSDHTYILPYSSSIPPGNFYNIAIVDIENKEVVKTISQPWGGTMSLQQIYDQPVAPLISLRDTLFVPTGQGYKWFLDDEFIGETNVNYWVPTRSGKYKAKVQFREYTTFSTEVVVNKTSLSEVELTTKFRITPNPTSEYIKIFAPAISRAEIVIRDLVGRELIKTFLQNESSSLIWIEDLPNGVYTVTVKAEGLDKTSKLIVKN